MLDFIKCFSSPSVSVVLAGISLVNVQMIFSIVAAILAIIYTTFKIIDWIEGRSKK